MQRSLWWGLLATGTLSAVALTIDDKPAKVVAAIARATAPSDPRPSPNSANEVTRPLPQHLEPLQIEPARRDIFIPIDAPAPTATVAAPVAPAPPPPPPPAPPALTWRYLGTMSTPVGERLVLLARGDTAVTVQAGTALEGGYVVEEVRDDAVKLVYPPLGTSVDVPIPPAPPLPR